MLSNPWPLEIVARERMEELRREAANERARRQARSKPAQESDPVVWREVFPGVDFRPLAGGPEMMITLMRFKRGAVAQLHHHRSAQAGYVLAGRLRLTLPDQQLTVLAGQCYLLPLGVPHHIRALDRAFVLDFFAPAQAPSENPGAEGVAGQLPTRDAGRSEAGPPNDCPAAPAARRRSGAFARLGRPRRSGRGHASAEWREPKQEPRDAT